MDRKAWWTIVHGVTKRIRYNLVIKQQQIFHNVYVHAAMFKMDNQQGPTIWHMEFGSVLCGRLDGKGVWRRMDICICMADFVHLKLSQHC